MKLKKIFASAVAAVAAITSVASLASCKKDDDVTDDGGNDQGGNENDAAAEIQAKLEAAINGLSVKSSYEADFTLTTTAAGGVTISWASNNVDVVKIENGKATVTRPGLTEADATVKLTATAVIDGETKIKEFTITIPHKTPDNITSKVTNENGYINIPFGAIRADGTYTIKVAEGKTITIEWTGYSEKAAYEEFGVAKKGETSNAIKITTSGVKLDALIADVYGSHDNMKCYIGSDNTGTNVKGTVRYDKGTEYTYLFSNDAEAVYFENPSDYDVLFYDLTLVVEDSYVAPAAPQVIEKTIAEALEFVSKQGYNMYTNDYYKLTGTVTEIQNDTYGNVVISDGTNSILIYGMYDTNNNRFDKMATKPAVGDTIVVQGILGNFQGTAQIKNGTLLEIQLTDAQKAEKEAKALAALIETEYDYAEEIKLASTVGTLAVTVQSGATALSFADGVLAINPTATEVTETVTISVTVGEETKTATVNVKTKAYAPEAGTFTVEGKYTAGTTTNMVEEKNNAKVIGLKPAVFNVTTDKIVYPSYSNTIGLNKDGSIRLYSNTQDGAKGDGNELTIALKDFAGYDLKITKITLTFGTGKNTPTFTVNGVAGSTSTAEYTINDSTVVIKNTTETSAQLWITNIKVEYTIVENTPVEYTVDLTKTEFNLKDEATMPTVEYDVYASVWGGTAATGTFIPVDADGKFDVIGSFTGVTLVLIKKGQEAAWSGENFLAQTVDYTVDETTVLAPFDGTEDYTEYALDLSKIQYNLSTETTLPAEYDVYVTVWGGTEPTGGLVQVDAEGKFKVLGTFTNATLLLIVKGETPAWEGEVFIAKTKDYTLTNTTIAGPFDGTEVAVEYTVDLSATKYNLKDDATMPTVEYDVYATVWGGTATSGTFIPVTLNGSFEVLGTFTNASLILIAKDQTPAWSGDNFLGQTTDYTVSETTLVAPISLVSHAEYVAATDGDALVIKGVVQLVSDTKKYVFLKDSEGNGYTVYNNSGVDTINWAIVGNEVVLSGVRGSYNKLIQLTSEQLVEVVSNDNNVAIDDVTDELTANGLTVTNEMQAKYVTFSGTIASISGSTINVTVGNNTIKAYDYTKAIPSFVTVGTNVQFSGTYIVYNATSQVGIYNATSYVDLRTDEEKAEDELDRLVALFGQNYTETTTIDLSSEIADVTVEITTTETTSLAWDSTTKTLTITPTTTEVAETLTIIVTVNQITKSDNTISFTSKIDENAPVTETVSLSFATTDARKSLSTEQQVWEQNGITFTHDKSSSTTKIADYSNPIRLYKNSKLSISHSNNISVITFNCNTAAYATALADSIVEGATVSVNEKVVTVKLTTPSTSFVIAALGAQVRINSFDVTYIVA